MEKRLILAAATAAAASIISSSFASGASVGWTDGGGDNSWITAGNWSTAALPGTGDTATFNTSAGGTVSLNGSTQSIAGLVFTGPAGSYTIGSATGDTLNFSSGGTIAVGPLTTSGYTGSSAQTINAGINIAGGTLNVSSAVLGNTLSLNGTISGAGALNLSSGATSNGGTILIAGNNTFTGGAAIGSTSSTTILIGSNTAFGAAAGTVTMNNTSNSPLEAYGSDITLANPVLLNFGFTVKDATSPHDLTFTGPIALAATGRTVTFFNYGQTVTLGASPNAATFTLATSTTTAQTLQIDVSSGVAPGAANAANAVLVLNDTIQDATGAPAGTLRYGDSGSNAGVPAGTYIISGANTYAGATIFGSQGTQPIVEIGSSSVGSPGAIVSGPFGKGTVTINDSNSSSGAPAIFEPYGADQTVANALTLSVGLFAANAPTTGTGATVDPAGTTHNLSLTGPITDPGKVITNNLAAGVGLYLGTATTSSAFTISTATTTFQSQTGTGTTYIYDQITGPGSVVVKQAGSVQLLNNGNNYAGTTSITGGTLLALNTQPTGSATGTGTVSVTGTGTLGSGGTLGGTGYLTGTVTVSSTSAASQGGIIAPGSIGPGTLNVGSLVLDPLGRYAFGYSGTSNTAGSGVNSLVIGSGTLDLSALSADSQFDLYLSPLSVGNGPTSYTLATFTSGIVNNGVQYPGGTDVTSLFSFSGTVPFTPDVQVVSGADGSESLELIDVAAPEPTSLGLLALAAGGTSWFRRRRP